MKRQEKEEKLKKCIRKAVLVLVLFLGSVWFLNSFAVAKKGGEPVYHITWSPPEISIAISPGYSWNGDFTFTSDKDLSEVEFFITPELKPFITISLQSFSAIVANTPNIVNIKMAVPTDAIPDNTYEGTIHLKIKHRTYPQTLKIVLYIAAALETVTEQAYNTTLELDSKAINDFYELEATYGADQSREMVVTWLKQQNEVVDAGISDSGDIWIIYKIGLDSIISTAPPGMNGSNGLAISNGYPEEVYFSTLTDITLGNKKAIILSPFYSQPFRSNPSDKIRDNLISLGYNTMVAYDEDVTVDLIKTLYQYGVVDWSTHGGLSRWGNKVMLATGEEATLLSFFSHISDIASFRITRRPVRYDYENKINNYYWAILPSFIEHYATYAYPNSLIHTDACYGLANTTMADAFIENGAYVYLGWNKGVYSDSATEVAESLFQYLADGMSIQQAYDKLKVGIKVQFNFYPSDRGDLILYTCGPTEISGSLFAELFKEFSELTLTYLCSPYIITSTISIPENKTLIIEPGVTLKFKGNNDGLDISGTLKAIGTEDKKIIFTSLIEGTPWEGLYFNETSIDSELNWVQISHTIGSKGREHYAIFVENSSIVFKNSIVEQYWLRGIKLTGSDSFIEKVNFLGPGLPIPGKEVIGIDIEQGSPIIQDCELIKDHEYGIYLRSNASPVIQGNNLEGNRYPIFVSDNSDTPPIFINNQGNNNIFDAISVRATIYGNAIWEANALPYLIHDFLVLSESSTLEIKPGVEVTLRNGAYFNVKGTLLAQGTAENKIIFTAFPNQAPWKEIYFEPESQNSILENTTISYGAGYSYKGALHVENTSVEFNNVIFDNNGRGGLFLENSDSVVQNSHFQNNQIGIRIEGTEKSPQITDYYFENNEKCDIYWPNGGKGCSDFELDTTINVNCACCPY